ncbi:MAG: restriction endonuclease [Acidimicrobiales bacterium]
MAELTRERAGEMVRAAFDVLMAHPDGLPAREVIAAVEGRLVLSEFEQGNYPSTGARRFDKLLRFSTIGPVKAGWLVKTKGSWAVTAEGRAAFERFSNPAEFMRESGRLYRLWKKSQAEEISETEAVDEVPVETAATTFEEADESAWAEISAYLANMPPYDFQELVAALLRAMGYHVPWVAPRGRDGGVDIVAFTDPIGATGPRIKVQVKRVSSGKIGVGELRSFLAVLGSQDVGLYVALAGFSPDADAEARTQETRRLMLLDAQRLVTLWIEHYGQLAEQDKQRLPLRPVYFLAPGD